MRRLGGYTLIELLVVLGVLALLATMAMPLSEMTVQRERESELRRALWEIRDALEEFRKAREVGAIASTPGAVPYPPTLEALTQAYPDQRADHHGESIRFLRQIPRDPFSPSSVPAAQTWALRSYLSEATNPHAGGDVYDVHSQSSAVGLNGVPVREW